MHEIPELIACEECDAVYHRLSLTSNEVALCLRCGAELERNIYYQSKRVLPLTIASLIVYFIANAFPIVELELQGLKNQTTLIGAVISLNREGMTWVSFIVLITTIIFPLIELLIMLYLFAPITQYRNQSTYNILLRWVQTFRRWGMIEVFLLGVIVALIKLSHLATVLPGIALWAFAALALLLAAVFSINPRYIWQMSMFEESTVFEKKEKANGE